MIKLYWNIGSQPARAVKALLQIGKIPHQTIQIDLKNNQTRTAQFLKLNPLGQIPFIITQTGFGIGQSNAIMQYICDKHSDKLSQYYGKDLQTRTKVNVFLSWYQSYYRPVLFAIIKIKIYGTIKQGIPHTSKQIRTADKAIGVALGYLQQYLKNSQGYIVGNHVSIADLLIYFETTNLIYYEMQNLIAQFENLNKWYKKIGEISQVKDIQQKWGQTVPGFKEFLALAKSIDS